MRSDFFKSPHHAALAAATLGAGFATGEPLYLILGGAAYVLGWVFVPDLGFFRSWVEKKQKAQLDAAAAGELADFKAKRDAALAALTNSRRQRYHTLAEVCRQIEQSISAADDPRVRKVEELMWTFLRLLGIDQSLERFLEYESRENLPKVVETASEEFARLENDVADLRAAGSSPTLDTKERLLNSRRDYLDSLKKRAAHVDQAMQNRELIIAEQERLDQQIKLLRADAMATTSPAAVSARIDATVEQLAATNAWLREMDQFRAMVAEPGLPDQRIGFGGVEPPPIPASKSTPNRNRQSA